MVFVIFRQNFFSILDYFVQDWTLLYRRVAVVQPQALSYWKVTVVHAGALTNRKLAIVQQQTVSYDKMIVVQLRPGKITNKQ